VSFLPRRRLMIEFKLTCIHIELQEGYPGNLTDDQEKGLKELWEKVS
jgi:hypothetical protein